MRRQNKQIKKSFKRCKQTVKGFFVFTLPPVFTPKNQSIFVKSKSIKGFILKKNDLSIKIGKR